MSKKLSNEEKEVALNWIISQWGTLIPSELSPHQNIDSVCKINVNGMTLFPSIQFSKNKCIHPVFERLREKYDHLDDEEFFILMSYPNDIIACDRPLELVHDDFRCEELFGGDDLV